MAKSHQGEIIMLKQNTIKKIGSIILSSVMTSTMVVTPVCAKEIEDNYPTEKTETVYVVVDDEGSISQQIVSNWIHDEDGIENIKEILNLTNVENVKTDEEPSVNGSEYTWNADGNDVYYQGNSDQKLPVTVKIKYELNGKEVSSKDLKNASGHLKIHVQYTNTESNTITSNGKTFNVHPFYVAGGIITFDNKNVSNVKCENGKIMNDGLKQIAAFVSIPGLEDTLQSASLEKVIDKFNISDECVIEADVKDYDPSDIMIGMTNEISINSVSQMDDITSIYSELSPLFEGEEQLLDGARQLSEGTQELSTKAKPLTDSSGRIEMLAQGTVQLNDGATQLQQSITQYVYGVDSLNQGNKQLNAIPTGIQTGLYGSQSLVDGSKSLMDNLETLNKSVQSLDLDSLKEFEQAIALSKQQLASLQSNLDTSKEALETVSTALQSAMEQSAILETNLKQLGTLLYNLQVAVQEDNAKVKDINAQIDSVVSQEQTSITTTVQVLTQAYNALNDENDPDGTSRAAIQEQINAVNSLSTTIGKVDYLNDFSTYQEQLQTISTNLTSSLQSMATILNGSKASFETLQTQLTQASTTLDTLETIASQTNEQLSSMKLSEQITALKQGTSQLYQGSKSIYEGMSQLDQGLEQLYTQSKAGIDQINAGSEQLVAYNDAILQGLNTLQNGTSELASNSDSLMEMSEGLTTLQDALDTLNDGAKTLYEGNQTFEDQGMSQLKELAQLGDTEIAIVQDIYNAIKDMKNESYSGAPEGAKVSTRFVFKIEQ